MLNYGLAVLESQVRMAVVAAGLDPTIGYFHGRYGGKQTLALDLMEPKRPLVDRAVLEFAKAHTFSAGDVTLLDGGFVGSIRKWLGISLPWFRSSSRRQGLQAHSLSFITERAVTHSDGSATTSGRTLRSGMGCLHGIR